jgi:FdhD protein
MTDEAKRAERQRITTRSVRRMRIHHTGHGGHGGHGRTEAPLEPDAIAVEEPLEIRLASDPFATIMRTPGEDHFLVAGFLFSEGIVAGLDELGKIAHCGRPTDAGYGNLVDVAPGPGHVLAPERSAERRGTIVSSACGVCGRERIDDLTARLGRVEQGEPIPAAAVALSITRLEQAQAAFARTGAMHGALAADSAGQPLAIGEDVGRHNAVDKVVGKLLYAGLLSRHEASARILAVSGRTSFEIVQKAGSARIGLVISVSAPTSLAIDTADALGITLVGFARGDGFNLYTHPDRIRV